MAAAAASGGEQQAAAPEANARARPLPTLDPRLFMAARRGDSRQLKDLLRIDDEEEATSAADGGDVPAVAVAAGNQVVVVDIHPPAAADAAPLHLLEEAMNIDGDSLLHVIAACGDGPEFLRCARMIVRHKDMKGGAAAKRLALEARNNDGDTPLHCATGAGNAAMIECLLGLLDHDHEPAAFVRLQNHRGETALHHAVKWACIMKRNSSRRSVAVKNEWASVIHANRLVHSGYIGKLVAVDAELASIVTHDGTSPLYIAISLGQMEIARYLLVTAKGGNLSYYSGPGGQNILHAAVSRGDVKALRTVLEWIKKGPKRSPSPSAIASASAAASSSSDDDVVRQLTSQREKKNGSTPLHLAASLFAFPSTGITPAWTWVRSGRPAARLLLDANVSTAYQPDKEGMYPIHAAAGSGFPSALMDLLERCPECATLRVAKGRTFLHVAVDNGGILVVRYVCRTPKLSWILNAQDKNGDTALHRAVHAGNYAVFSWLLGNRGVRLDVANKEGVLPIDVAWTWSTMPLRAYYACDPRTQILNSLLKVSAPYDGASRGDLFRGKLLHAATTTTETNKDVRGGVSEGLTSAAQVMGILSVLVTTVTFATAFTLPGGYRSAGDGGGGVPGTPVLAGSYAFDAFLLADALAFICSLLATSLLLYAGVPAGSLTGRFYCLNCAYALMMNSGRSLVAAFGLGLYVVMSPVARVIPIAIAVLAAMLASVFIKGGEGIDSMLFIWPIFPRRRPPSATEVVAAWVVSVLERFWSFILIFGLPAIRKWAGER
ncbi:hypothetical protein BS78_10G004300 [Paspalum vaginatum]|nr:hypothetical protein BS78_10G004300 [Paspalum vaginatum]